MAEIVQIIKSNARRSKPAKELLLPLQIPRASKDIWGFI
jgi:hypothetical protein